MANLFRQRYDFESGKLGANLSAGGTTITFEEAPGFATLGSDEYIAISLVDDDATPNYEIVYLTAYTAGATTGTIERAQEGTSASAFTTDHLWEHAPTVEDFRAPISPIGSTGSTDYMAYPGFVVTGFDGSDSYDEDTLYYIPIRIERTITVTAMAIDVSASNTGSGGSLLRMGIYAADTDFQPTDLILDAGTVAIDTTGRKSITGLTTVLTPGIYLKVHNNNSTGGVDLDSLEGGMSIATGSATSGQQAAYHHYVSSTFGALAATGVNWDSDDMGNGESMRHPILMSWTS